MRIVTQLLFTGPSAWDFGEYFWGPDVADFERAMTERRAARLVVPFSRESTPDSVIGALMAQATPALDADPALIRAALVDDFADMATDADSWADVLAVCDDPELGAGGELPRMVVLVLATDDPTRHLVINNPYRPMTTLAKHVNQDMKRLMTEIHARLNATSVAISENAAVAEAECFCGLVAVGELVIEAANLKKALQLLKESVELMEGPPVPACTIFDQPSDESAQTH